MTTYEKAKEILQRACPESKFRSQGPDWKGEFPLPNSITEYFRELGPVDVEIPAYGNPYLLPSLYDLWAFQAGYRYHPATQERFAEWDDDWLVIADEGGDPFILSRSSETVLHDYQGEGVWAPRPMFDGLEQMAMVFAIIGDIVASAGQALVDNDALILPVYREEARTRIGEIISSNERASDVLVTLGWS
jgi:hypothetical protein